MKRNFYFLFILLGWLIQGKAQQNITQLSNFDFAQDANDIWGYVAPDSTEYALIGLRNGLAVVNIANPTQPFLRDFIPGDNSTWRDIKTEGEFVYVIADEGNDGLLAIDMTLHDQVVALGSQYHKPVVTINGITDTLQRGHNIYIDENGICYMAGSNLYNGAVVFFDVRTTPGTPNHIGQGHNEYAHDVFVRGDTMYSSDIYQGYFSVVDIADKTNPLILATQNTPFQFTHNAWLSDDGKTLFTTDERGDAPVASYDISDLSDVKELDAFRPPSTLGQGVIPHNVHVKGDYLVISHYSDGIIVVDATNPANMVQTGQYDTYTSFGTGFEGCWGAYPFLPSGLILASDITSGLYVLDPTYTRASYLEGLVTDASNGTSLDDVKVSPQGSTITTFSDASGNYKTGFATSGTIDVVFSKSTYESRTVTVTLVNGQLTTENVQLTPLVPFTMTGTVIDDVTNSPIPNAKVTIYNNDLEYDATTDVTGTFTMPTFYEGDFTAIAAHWGHKTVETNQFLNSVNNSLQFKLVVGYEDHFAVDLGWTVSGTATTGMFVRDFPVETPGPFPSSDVILDIGRKAFVTGTDPTLFNNVNGGNTVLTSPVFDLSGYTDPHVRYYSYSASVHFADTIPFPFPQGDDTLKVMLSNGTTTVTIEEFPGYSFPANWYNSNIRVADFLTPTSTMQIIFETSDYPSSLEDVTVAGIDYFRVTEEGIIGNEDLPKERVDFKVFPNPFSEETILALPDNFEANAFSVEVYNALGQLIETQFITDKLDVISVGASLDAGIYFVKLVTDDKEWGAVRVVKAR